MTPQRLLATAIAPALAELAAVGIVDSPDARRIMLAIALQESGLKHRRQVGSGGDEDGPAASYWQFEKGGGCKGVLSHKLLAPPMRLICDAYNVQANAQAMWEAMRYQDIVAAAAARLLIYSLPGKLPTTAVQGWEQYLSAWRPGKPHPETWAGHWATATAITGALK
jgi:hypothetical protein